MSIYCIREFIIESIYEEPTCKLTILTAMIKPNFPETRNCFVPYCYSCMMDYSKKRSTGTSKVNHLPEKEVYLTRYKYEVGYFVCTDRFICITTGQVSTV